MICSTDIWQDHQHNVSLKAKLLHEQLIDCVYPAQGCRKRVSTIWTQVQRKLFVDEFQWKKPTFGACEPGLLAWGKTIYKAGSSSNIGSAVISGFESDTWMIASFACFEADLDNQLNIFKSGLRRLFRVRLESWGICGRETRYNIVYAMV